MVFLVHTLKHMCCAVRNCPLRTGGTRRGSAWGKPWDRPTYATRLACGNLTPWMPMLEVGGSPGSKCRRSKVEEPGEGEVYEVYEVYEGRVQVLVLGRGVGAMVGHVALQSQARWRRA